MAKKNWEIYFEAVKKQDWAAAKSALNAEAKVDKANPQVYLKLGDVCQRAGDTPGAITAYHVSARIQRFQGFNQKALALYKIILRLDPKNTEAIERSGELMDEMASMKSSSISRQSVIFHQEKLEEYDVPVSSEPVTSSIPAGADIIETTSYTPEEEGIVASSMPTPAATPPEDSGSDRQWMEATALVTEKETPGDREVPVSAPGPAEAGQAGQDWLESSSYAPEEKAPVEPEIVSAPLPAPHEEPEQVSAGFDFSIPEEEISETADLLQETPSGELEEVKAGFDFTLPEEELPEPTDMPQELPSEEPGQVSAGFDFTLPEEESPESPAVTPQASAEGLPARGEDIDIGIAPEESMQSMTDILSELPDDELNRMLSDLIVPISERKGGSVIPELFSGMNEQEYQLLLSEMDVKSFGDGIPVITEGDTGDSMYIIRSGRARVVTHMLGRDIELAELEEGDVFGEVAFLTGRPRTATVLAKGPLSVLEVGRKDIERIIENDPDVLSKLEDFYESRVKDTIRKVMPKP